MSLIAGGALAQRAASSPAGDRPDRIATIETDHGAIRVRLLARSAPRHVENFIELAAAGLYDRTTFHRVLPGYLIQGGSPTSRDDDRDNDNFGGPGYTLELETNELAHVRGALAMARDVSTDRSGGSQFFIVLDAAPMLDLIGFTIFGQVIDGLEVADRIGDAPRDRDNHDRPLAPVVVRRIRVDELVSARTTSSPVLASRAPSSSPVAGRASPPPASRRPGASASGPGGTQPTPGAPTPVAVTVSRGPQGDGAASTTPKLVLGRMRVRTASINVRSGPGTGHSVVARLSRGARVDIVGADGAWKRVDLGRVGVGYIREDLLEPIAD